ncbi:hypothetical protein OBBRIDRAFT_797752 [Obba rivulosa]|uniref:MSP domain-containing protein n=1 Tax=Obba rivulosa TaxID=1052685 RepID=A0A8E2AM45_9APHY|nr:hypothetical protein OBBRIDRAFT_797752 [Obba rivulosa]
MSIVAPSVIRISRPVTQRFRQPLGMTNPNDYAVAFKILTNNPQVCSVKPAVGLLDPGQTVEIRALSTEPPEDFECRDNLKILSMAIVSEKMSTTELRCLRWNDSSNQVHEHKVAMSFVSDEERTALAKSNDLESDQKGHSKMVQLDTRDDCMKTEYTKSPERLINAPPPYDYAEERGASGSRWDATGHPYRTPVFSFDSFESDRTSTVEELMLSSLSSSAYNSIISDMTATSYLAPSTTYRI